MKGLVIFIFFLFLTSLGCRNAKVEDHADSNNKELSERAVTETESSEPKQNQLNSEKRLVNITPEKKPNTAHILFSEQDFNFGDIKEGDVIEHHFSFINDGDVPLIISKTETSCGCTVPEYPKSAINPGEKGEIKVTFNSKGKTGKQEANIMVFTNGFPDRVLVQLKGMVAKQPE